MRYWCLGWNIHTLLVAAWAAATSRGRGREMSDYGECRHEDGCKYELQCEQCAQEYCGGEHIVLVKQLAAAHSRIEMLIGEVEMLRGVGCNEEWRRSLWRVPKMRQFTH